MPMGVDVSLGSVPTEILILVTYYYRLQGLGLSNLESAFSPVFSGTPSLDPAPFSPDRFERGLRARVR